MYIKCYAEPVDKYQRNYKIHLWDDEEGYIEEKYHKVYTVMMGVNTGVSVYVHHI